MNAKPVIRLLVLSCVISLAWTCTSYPANLLVNPGFESGDLTGWTWWDGKLAIVPGSPQAGSVHGGSFCALAFDRTQAWQGPVQSLLGILKNGKAYRFSAWVKLQGTGSDRVSLTVAQTDASAVATQYHGVVDATIQGDQWTPLSGVLTVALKTPVTAVNFYIEGPQPGTNFYIDDVNVEEIADWRIMAAERTEQIRKRQMTLTVLASDGNAVSGMTVRARQVKHLFAFGSCINGNVTSTKSYADFFRAHFEWAVCENESKWYTNEANQGAVTYSGADSIYSWCQQNGITMRGHCLYWDAESTVQSWLKALNKDQLREAVEKRMESAVPHFKGKFVHWDINNEMVPNHYYEDHLGEDIRLYMFNRAHEIDPNATLFVNEYNVIENGGYLDRCIQLVQWLQARNAPVQAVGAQCHFNSGFDRWAVINRFDKLAALGLPIWCTEFDMVAATDTLRANEIEDFYRIAFSHPAVKGILMWGFWQNSFWKDNCYIVNADWSLNEAGRRYETLLKEWTTDTKSVTDANGAMTFRGFHGSYEITVYPPGIRGGIIVKVDLPEGDQPAAATIQIDAAGGAAVLP
jgi:endo-1,4-beta-xylanase